MKEVIKNLEDAIKEDWKEVRRCSTRITNLEESIDIVKGEQEEHAERIRGREKALAVLRMADGLESKDATGVK